MIDCIVTTLAETKVYKKLRSVQVPAVTGALEVLPGHAEAFAFIAPGNLILEDEKGHIEKIRVGKGECHIYNNTVTIIM
jgi:F0F1-type ATP synthase epsilon subunit